MNRELLLITIFFFPIFSAAQTPEEKGLAISREAERRDEGWKDSRATLKMLLYNRHGETSSRVLRRQSLEVNAPGLGDKSIVVFESPKDIEGTALLSHTKLLEPDDQWLYLPALKRIKRISSSNKSGPFVGSEFAYEDMLSQETEKYKHRFLREEACGKLRCFVIERKPLYKNSGYTKFIAWFDTAEYRILKVDFYDRKNSRLKTLSYKKYGRYKKKFWRALEMKMINHQTGKKTVLEFESWELDTGIGESEFLANRLKRAR